MRTPRPPVIVLAAALSLIPSVGRAHHSFAAQYDSSRVVTLRGVVDRFDWTNPHAILWVEADAGAPNATTWAIEVGSPNGLTRTGVSRKSLRKGDAVVIECFLAKDGSHQANGFSIRRADGTVVLGSPGEKHPLSR